MDGLEQMRRNLHGLGGRWRVNGSVAPTSDPPQVVSGRGGVSTICRPFKWRRCRDKGIQPANSPPRQGKYTKEWQPRLQVGGIKKLGECRREGGSSRCAVGQEPEQEVTEARRDDWARRPRLPEARREDVCASCVQIWTGVRWLRFAVGKPTTPDAGQASLACPLSTSISSMSNERMHHGGE